MKKIIFFHLLNDYSGSPKVLSQVIAAILKKGINVELFCGGGKNGFLSSVPCVQRQYFYRRFNSKYITLLSYSLSQFILFFKLLSYRKSSTVFYVNTMLPFGAALAGKILQIKVFYHIHETSVHPKLLKLFLRWMVDRCSSKNIFVSHFLAEEEYFPKIKSRVIYNSISQNMVRIAANHIYKIKPSNKICILMICSLKSYKGINELISIANLLVYNKAITFQLILGASDAQVARFFSDTKLPDNLVITSQCDDVIPFYKKASVLLNLSKPKEWVETFGLTILEALSFGIPCIVPPVGGPVELVSNDKEGYLIDSGRVKEISTKLEFLQKNPDTCFRLSKAAKIKSLSFSVNNFESNVLAEFNDL
ncbi:glycosyltransferase family 4 protein [Candidatus Pseudomonas adelgestsugas]|uniref:glycosyltransferase family 4 protein n=1 Tax=Candidatus Pseudomonas adelgestsugas TaxID=1302376 RepID=UPI00100E753D|nr:glycosyltransferase family 4 protein [Candidatus Pseudomonas adelgestsugas]